MLRIDGGKTGRYCDGMSRRNFVQLGVAGMATAGLPQVLRAREEAYATTGIKKDTSVILIWLDGGPSHIDLYDLKPDAPAEYRGIWRPIKTNVPGFDIGELCPLQAKVADKFSIVRSLHHDNGDHFAGGHWMLTARGGASGGDQAIKSPSICSIATKLTGPRQAGMPAHVAVPYAMSIGLRPGYFGPHYLGVQHKPFETGGDPNNPKFQVDNFALPTNLTIDRLEDRRTLLQAMDKMRRNVDSSGTLEAMNRFEQQAYELVSGERARKAFDLSSENPALRDRYGRNQWGQSTLLARRLVEAGSTWVSVHYGGWDHHWDLQKGYDRYMPQVDAAVASLLTDISDRGLFDNVCVVLCGEFGRTPRMNDGGNGGPPGSKGTPGRDHWGNAMFCLMAGGGIKGGRIVGSTNAKGEVPKDRPLEPCDIHATLYHVLGVDQNTNFLNHAGRPVPALDRGEVIRELL